MRKRTDRYTYVEEDNMNRVKPFNLSPVHIPTKLDNISYRLRRRKNLLDRRRMIINLEVFFAMFGIVLMLIETELYFAKVCDKKSALSIVIKSLISASTLVLIVAVAAYHLTGVQIKMTDNLLDHWRLAFTPFTYAKLVFEMLVCSIHPIPGMVMVPYTNNSGKQIEVSVDAVLSILMLSRLYLIVRLLVVHSHLLADTSTQSIGALNKVRISPSFVFKALMSESPGMMLISIMCGLFVLNCWAMRACEGYYYPGHENSMVENSVWMIAITFLTVGYGDMIPKSECGRFIAITTGLMGVGITALLVAVMAHKLEQTRAEKYVHNFVTRIQLDKIHKNAAADIIKSVLKLWKLKAMRALTLNKRLVLHGKLHSSITAMRQAKHENALLGESSIGLIEIHRNVDDLIDIAQDLKGGQAELNNLVRAIEKKLFDINTKLDNIEKAIVNKAIVSEKRPSEL